MHRFASQAGAAALRPISRLALTAVAAVALAACGSSGGQPTGAGNQPSAAGGSGGSASACQSTDQTGGVAATIANFTFSPATIQAKVGQAITWTNNDTAKHGAVLDDGSCSTGSFGQGGSGSLVFSAPGTYTYHCTVHGKSMTGTITVTG